MTNYIIRMTGRPCRVIARRLTVAEINLATEPNDYDNEGDIVEEEESFDEATDSEEDVEEDYLADNRDSDGETDEKVADDESPNLSEFYIGRDETEWRSQPHDVRSSARVPKSNFHTLNIESEAHIDCVLDCFAFFMNLLNVAGVAAFIIHRIINHTEDEPTDKQRKKFIVNLCEELSYDHIKRRPTLGLSHIDQANISTVLAQQDDAEASTSAPPQKRRRCAYCPSRISRKVKQICSVCRKNVCNEHAIAILKCKKCAMQPIINSSDSE